MYGGEWDGWYGDGQSFDRKVLKIKCKNIRQIQM